VTLDLDELLRIVQGSRLRGFTDFGCQRFFPNEECPTLVGLPARSTKEA
jgi:hypothetical protein